MFKTKPKLPKSLSLSDISQAPPEPPQRSKNLNSIDEVQSQVEKSIKKKSPLSRAVHKLDKRIKSVDLTGLTSLRSNQKLRKSVKNEIIGYNVSNSTFFQTSAEEIPEVPEIQKPPQDFAEAEEVNEGAIEEEDLSDDNDETISDDQTLVHEVDVAVVSLQGVSEYHQEDSGKKHMLSLSSFLTLFP